MGLLGRVQERQDSLSVCDRKRECPYITWRIKRRKSKSYSLSLIVCRRCKKRNWCESCLVEGHTKSREGSQYRQTRLRHRKKRRNSIDGIQEHFMKKRLKVRKEVSASQGKKEKERTKETAGNWSKRREWLTWLCCNSRTIQVGWSSEDKMSLTVSSQKEKLFSCLFSWHKSF
jgi:hypothetical protein